MKKILPVAVLFVSALLCATLSAAADYDEAVPDAQNADVTSQAPAPAPAPAVVYSSDRLEQVLQKEDEILQKLDEIYQELEIVKIRASQR